MKFSVVIPSRNIDNLLPCVEAIFTHERIDPEHVVVVDDGLDMSRDVDGLLSEVTILPNQRDDGKFCFSKAVNTGIKSTAPRVNVTTHDDPEPQYIPAPYVHPIIVLNDDALLETQKGFSILAALSARHPEYGVIASVTNNVGNRNQLPQGIGLRDEPRMVCFICALISPLALNEVGLLDEDFRCYSHQDDDYCLRVRRAGMKIGIFDGCSVDHGSLTSTFRGHPGAGGELETGAAIFRRKWGAHNHAL